jgi:hypothetical protein
MVVATLGAAVMSVAALSGQDKGSTVVYRGCLNLGTTEGTFFMSKASEKSQKDKEKISLKVTPATDKVKLEPFVLKEVEISGTFEAAPAGGSAEGGEQPGTLKATKVTWKNDYCG